MSKPKTLVKPEIFKLKSKNVFTQVKDEEKQNKNTAQYVLDTTIRKQHK